MLKYIKIVIIIICFTSCKTITIQKENQYTTTQTIMLGVIGNQKTFVLAQDYNHVALPNFKQPIKVQPNLVAFNKRSFSAFKKAEAFQKKNININYVDSVKTNRPTFLNLEIADRISIIKALKKNKEIFQYLENNNNAHIVTTVSIVLNQENKTAITDADEVLLETAGIKNYVLKTYKNKALQKTIKFTDGVVFAYQTAKTCWKEDSKHQLQIIDLVDCNDKCSRKSYKSAKRAKTKNKLF